MTSSCARLKLLGVWICKVVHGQLQSAIAHDVDTLVWNCIPLNHCAEECWKRHGEKLMEWLTPSRDGVLDGFVAPAYFEASKHILEDINVALDACPILATIEIVANSVRFLHYLMQASTVGQFLEDASVTCRYYQMLDPYLSEIMGTAGTQHPVLQTAVKRNMIAWRQLGVLPETLCTAVRHGADSERLWPLPITLQEIQLHDRCVLRAAAGHHAGIDNCRVPSVFQDDLASKIWALQALQVVKDRASAPTAKIGNWGPWLSQPLNFTNYTGQKSQEEDQAVEKCSLFGRSIWAHPVASTVRCKYCLAGHLLGLKKDDRVFDFGGHCGFGAAWLATAFEVHVTWLGNSREDAIVAAKVSAEGSTPLHGVYVGETKALADFQDESFEAVVVSPEVDRYHVVQSCAFVRTHFLRLLVGGGTLWINGLGNGTSGSELRDQWISCLGPLVELGIIQYSYISDFDLFGVTESNLDAAYSIFIVRMPFESMPHVGAAAVLNSWPDVKIHREMYACKAEEKVQDSLTSLISEFDAWASKVNFQMPTGTVWADPGPSYWACVETRLSSSATSGKPIRGLGGTSGPAKQAAPRLWTVPSFVSLEEANYVRNLGEKWIAQGFEEAEDDVEEARGLCPGCWVDDVMMPTGMDAVTDLIEDRLEQLLGMPLSHSDPWHMLRYEPGFEKAANHTDCAHPGYDPLNDRQVTVLVWLTPCEDGMLCGIGEGEGDQGDGATVFVHYGKRIRVNAGDLVIYSNMVEGASCNLLSEHFASPLSSAAKHPKVLLQKWFYEYPVEPTMPPSSLICDRPDEKSAICKSFLVPPGCLTPQVQKAHAILQNVFAESQVDPDKVDRDKLAHILTNSVDGLAKLVSAEIQPDSLGRSGNWRTLFLLGSLMHAHHYFGAGPQRRRESLMMLRLALQRCPFDIELLHTSSTLWLNPNAAMDAQLDLVANHCEARARLLEMVAIPQSLQNSPNCMNEEEDKNAICDAITNEELRETFLIVRRALISRPNSVKQIALRLIDTIRTFVQ